MSEFLTAEWPVPAWLLILMLLGNLAWPVLLLLRMRKHADFEAYNSDQIFGLRWTWSYRKGEPVDLVPHCIEDHTAVVYNSNGTDVSFHCETCGREVGPLSGDYSYVIGMAKRQIDRKLKVGDWK